MDVDNETPKDISSNPINKIIRERSAEIISGGNVFYNPVQEFNRDLSISVLNVYFKRLIKERQEKDLKKIKKSKNEIDSQDESSVIEIEYIAGTNYDDGLRILEALSATGLRSIRYAKEIAGVKEIIANDLSKQAVDAINENVKHNNVEHLIEPSQADAMAIMYLSSSKDKQFDCIDLDPYGCPNRFLDGAIQSINERYRRATSNIIWRSCNLRTLYGDPAIFEHYMAILQSSNIIWRSF